MKKQKFEPHKSYYANHTGEVCGVCGNPLTHPPILLPAGPAYVKMDKDNVQSETPLLEFVNIKVCHTHALVLLAELDYDPNNPDEGRWYRDWLEGEFEPIGIKPNKEEEDDD